MKAPRAPKPVLKTVLICHEGALFDQDGLARWLSSFSCLVGLVVLRESYKRILRVVRHEIRRGGIGGLLNVLAFQIYYRLFMARKDELWERWALEKLRGSYPQTNENAPVLYATGPNAAEVKEFVESLRPDIMLARCKTLLKEDIFTIPRIGTFVMHPGICPEYRNAHGCFWALANGKLDKVGITLLQVGQGVDTGPVYGYYTYPYDEVKESHHVIQQRAVLENLDKLKSKLLEIYGGSAIPLDTTGRDSVVWGKPQLTSYLKWRRRVRKARRL